MKTERCYRSYDLVEARKYVFNKEPARHQELALRNLFNWYDENKDHSKPAGEILVLPTGSGKTFVAIRFLCLKPLSDGYKILWLAHTHHLLDQSFKEFDKHLNKIAETKKSLNVRIVSGCKGHFRVGAIKPDDDVLIATLQTVSKAYDDRHPALEAFLKSSGGKLFVVFDEAHHAPAPSYRRLISELREQYKEMYILGLTATPIYSDERFAGWLTKLFPQGFPKVVTAQDLMAQGILSQPISEQAETRIAPEFDDREYQKWIGTFRDLPEDIITQLAKNRERNLYIAKFYADNSEKYGKTLIFADRWYQCEAISDFLNQHGIRTGTVYSHVDADPEIVGERKKRKSDENSRVLEAFRKGELDVVINVRMLTEGTDVPDVKTVFVTRQTTSKILLTQMVGRALRGPKFGGTDKAYLVFFIDEWKKLINWAEYEPISPHVGADEEIEYGKRPPLQYISIELVRKLDEMMYQGIDINSAPFKSLLPIGWYRIEYVAQQGDGNHLTCEQPDDQVDHEHSDGKEIEADVEQMRRLVMVFEHEQENYEQFVDFLIDRPPKKFEAESIQFEEVKSSLDTWRDTFFPDIEEHFGSDLLMDIFGIARHISQNETKPKFFKFEDRDLHDLDDIAEDHITRSLGPMQIDEKLEQEYKREDRYWKVFYQTYDQFKDHYNLCQKQIVNKKRKKLINGTIYEKVDFLENDLAKGLVCSNEENNDFEDQDIVVTLENNGRSFLSSDFIKFLQNLGLNRISATALVFLLNKNEASSREIELAANLRQPEVSKAMQDLRERGWIDEKDTKHDGKGRPNKIFTIKINSKDLIKFFEEEVHKDFARGIENIPKLISSTKAGTISILELVNSLQTLGANRYVSNIIAHMANSKNEVAISFREIELATGLRQPEVSLGVQELRKKGWINESEIKHEGKGRPTKTIKLNADIEDIIQQLEKDKRQELAVAAENIEKLKKIFGCN